MKPSDDGFILSDYCVIQAHTFIFSHINHPIIPISAACWL
ncbi:hypothetical protein SALWKB12_1278 [Snodgrassella communis]|nr:hypothetical protein SALWKB12_1278 [Snodgrassella communis]